MFDVKNMKNAEEKKQCECSMAQGLFMHSRQVSIIVAGLLMLSFFLFMGGYFLGQKNAVTAFSAKIDQESFGDQIYSSLCSLSDSRDIEDEDEGDEEGQEEVNKQEPVQHSAIANDASLVVTSLPAQAEVVASEDAPDVDDQDAPSAQFFAQLAGFGTSRAAHQFAQKLARKEISVVVKERQSRSARGKFVSWYQVVTEKFEDKNELKKLIVRLESEEKLKGVNIVTC